MQVIRAAAMGMCFGVRDALEVVHGIEQPETVTIHGELVHNPQVLVQLEELGFHRSNESGRRPIPQTPDVLITAHGISDRERERLKSAGKHLIDTTCPLVHRVHEAAQRLERQGYHVLVIGRAGHVEVQGIIEDLASFDVIGSLSDVRCWPYDRLGVICQTTTPPRIVPDLLIAIEAANPHAQVKYVDTICLPTLERQYALERLRVHVDAVVVVGGPNSNNTRQLVALARELGTPAWSVQSAADLEPQWFAKVEVVGLTAGTSVLDETVDEVHEALVELSPEPLAAASSAR